MLFQNAFLSPGTEWRAKGSDMVWQKQNKVRQIQGSNKVRAPVVQEPLKNPSTIQRILAAKTKKTNAAFHQASAVP